MKFYRNDVSIVLCGEAGQGIQTVETLLTKIIKRSGYYVFGTKEYMSRIRGGSNSTLIRVSSSFVNSNIDRIDILVAMDKDAISHLLNRISKDTIIIGDKDKINTDKQIINVPFSNISQSIGSSVYENSVAVGVISGIFSLDLEIVHKTIKEYFNQKGEKILLDNLTAIDKGYQIGKSFTDSGKIKLDIKKNLSVIDYMLISGTDAIALGALAGGCNFVAGYPMTPSTGILTFFSKYAKDVDIITIQAEDEISAVNMALGAWYAGGRAMITTAGGGFSLMIEGLSLAGMIESPLVLCVGQRPAPATGLPTRTEQSDLQHVIYSGHGEFPRIVYAPGNIIEAFFLTMKAFNDADKYQIPVIILFDQYLADTYYLVKQSDLENINIQQYIIRTDNRYKRYRFTDTGISPRGIPGYGEGLVGVDSDEHDQDGHITEDHSIRTRMVEKRFLKKMELLNYDAIPPKFEGEINYKNLIIGWGSTYGIIKEALEYIKDKETSLLHFSQVYPIHQKTIEYLKKAENIIVIENNASSQFGRLIKINTGIDINKRILKYDGLPFSVEELVSSLTSLLQK